MNFSEKTSNQIEEMIERDEIQARVVTLDKKGKKTTSDWKPARMLDGQLHAVFEGLPYHPDYTVLTRWDIENCNWAEEQFGISLHINNNLRFELRKVG